MIESIDLTNWKTHRHTSMRFQRGVNVLIGVMGAGKSSVMDAISFALFGTFPALKSKNVSTKDLISSRPRVEDNAEVKLTFSVGTEKYTVFRKLSKKESAFARLEKDGTYIQTQPERVTEEIEALLKIDYDTFSRAIYAEQNRLDYFLELAKGERKRQIDQMLGLDNFSRAEENATSLINNLRNRVKEDEQTLSQLDVRQYKVELERLGLERSKLLEENQKLTEQVTETKARVKSLESNLSGAKKEQEKRNLLAKEMDVAKARIGMLKTEMSKVGEIKGTIAALEKAILEKRSAHDKLGREVKELKANESVSLKKLAGSEADLCSSESKMRELEKIKIALEANPLSRTEAELSKFQGELEGSAKSAAVSESRITEAEAAMKELEKHISKCPICERDLSDELKTRLVEEKKALLSRSRSELEKANEKTSTLRESVRKARERHEKTVSDSKRMEEYKTLLEALPKLKEGISKEKRIHEAAASAYEKTYAQLDPLQKELNGLTVALDAAKRLERYTKEAAQLSETVSLKSREYEFIKIDDKEVDQLQSSMLTASKSLSEFESKSESNSKYMRSLDLQISEKTKGIARIVQIEEKLERLRGMVAEMNKFKGALVETESALRGRLVGSINSLMQEIWTKIYPYGDYRAVRLNAGRDDYLLEAVAGDGPDGQAIWSDVNGIASGGEKSMACLAMRISMSMVIVPNLRWLILDEPTHNIDENGIARLVQVLGEVLPGIVEQVFIITHDNALKNIGGARVYQLGRDKAKNEPTSFVEL